jgi:hypothetical protein
MPLTINDETIPDDLLQEEFQLIKSHYEQMGAMSCCERDPEFREYARENVIARVLLNQAAEKEFPKLEESEIATAIDRIVTEHGGPDEVCAKLGVTSLEDPLLRQDVISGLRMDKMFAKIWGDSPAPTEAELQDFLAANTQDYLTDERIRALAIFKQVEKVEERDAIYNRLRGLRKEALAGADFEAMATEHTDKEDKNVDLGWFRRGEFMDEFDLIFFSLGVGEISPVFASHWGFHLAKIVGHEPAVVRPFEEIRSLLEERILTERRQAKTKEFIETLKSKAVIDVEKASVRPSSE